MISIRTMDISYEILCELDVPDTLVILRYGIDDIDNLEKFFTRTNVEYKNELKLSIGRVENSHKEVYINAIIQRQHTIRNSTNPRYRFDEKWNILKNSLLLDGYIIDNGRLIEQDPIISETIKSDENLFELIKGLGIDYSCVIRLLKNSRSNFESIPADYNACLINVRTPLEFLMKNIALKVVEDQNEDRDIQNWGNAITYLRSKNVITVKDEVLLTSIYSLLSELHRPVFIDEKEMTRYARSLGLNSIWYICNIYSKYIS